MTSEAGTSVGVSNLLNVQNVSFRCPSIGPETLPKVEWEAKIQLYLEEQLRRDKALGSCLMIRTLNRSDTASECVDILCRYLTNLIAHPDDDKYKKIRKSNVHFVEKVSRVKGALEFLESAGFQNQNGQDPFLIWKNDNYEQLEFLTNLLQSSKPIVLELNRNPLVIYGQKEEALNFPDDFFSVTVDELRREQKRRSDKLKTESRFRTKSTRDKELKPPKMYEYTLIRVRFPDGIYLQGTFQVDETFGRVRQFVSDCLLKEVIFALVTAFGKPLALTEDKRTLSDLNLVPAVLLNINFKLPGSTGKSLIKPELISKHKTS